MSIVDSAKGALKGSTGTGNGELDPEDLVALIAIPAFAGHLAGVFSFSVDVFGGFALDDTLFTIGTVDLSLAMVVLGAAVAFIFATNAANGYTDHSGEAKIGYAIAASPILIPLMPAFKDLVMWSEWMQIGYFVIVSGAAAFVSYDA